MSGWKVRGEKDTKKMVREVASEAGQNGFTKGRAISQRQQLWVVSNPVMNWTINKSPWTYILVNLFYTLYTILYLNHSQ